MDNRSAAVAPRDAVPILPDRGTAAAVSGPARTYALLLLTAVYGLNFLDRTIFNVLIEPIRAEFHLSDTTIGLLAGFGFALLYCVLGLPVARLADRTNRRNVVVAGLAVWSAMTAACGLAHSTLALAASRIGVGVGESAGTPASQAIISDMYDEAERPRALGIYAVGTYLGVFAGYFIGGWVTQFYNWRVAFLAAGLPGIVVALLLWFTVKEPARRGAGRVAGPGAAPVAAGEGVRRLLSTRTFVVVLLGFYLTSVTNYATTVWIPPFLARIHHLSPAEVGSYGGTFKGLFGIAGTLSGGLVSAFLARFDRRWLLWAPAIMSALAGPVFVLCLLTPSFAVSMGALAAFSLLVGFHLGPIFSVGQLLPPPGLRALSAAVLLLTGTLVGQGLGPLAVGAANDALRGTMGVDAIRYSLLLPALTTVLGALLFLVAARTLRRDVGVAS